MSAVNTYQNKFFSILGDSISTLEGYNPPNCGVFYDWVNKYKSGVFTPDDTWWGQVVQRLGGRILVNNSYSGSCVCKLPAMEIESYGCSDKRTSALGMGPLNPGVIIIFLGTNDWGKGLPVFPTEFRSGLSVFATAYEAMLTKIKTNYPNAEIWCLTLPCSYPSQNPNRPFPTHFGGRDIADYCTAIRECATRAGCKVVDIYKPQSPFEAFDEFHPSADGMKTISELILAELESAYDH